MSLEEAGIALAIFIIDVVLVLDCQGWHGCCGACAAQVPLSWPAARSIAC